MEQMMVNKSGRQQEYKSDVRWGRLVISVLVPLVIGVISALLSAEGMMMYASMKKPPGSPPGWVFSVAWSILYIMMGAAYYFAMEGAKKNGSSSEMRWIASTLYIVQLIWNFMWSLLFFRWELRLLAFVWLLMLVVVVFLCVRVFMQMDRLGGWMMVPYAAWLLFAGYLNMGTYLMNR